jgi:hypothetical protein
MTPGTVSLSRRGPPPVLVQGLQMKRLPPIRSALIVCSLLAGGAKAGDVLKPVALPSADGEIAGATFSPDSARLALVRNSPVRGTPGPRYVLQILDLRTNQELAQADVLNAQPWDTHVHIEYSPDGRYILLAANGSDVLSIVDASSPKNVREVALNPQTNSRKALAPSHYPSGVVSLARPSKGDLFGVLTSGNDVFMGSFSSGQILRTWGLGKGRSGSELGQTSLALNEDGSSLIVPLLPYGNSLPKGFDNLRLYNPGTGEMVKSIRTNGLIGQVVLLANSIVLAAPIDAPGLFSKKVCIEKWNLNSGNMERQYCDQGRNIVGALNAAPAVGKLVGFASHPHKDIEGHVYAAPGRVDTPAAWATPPPIPMTC